MRDPTGTLCFVCNAGCALCRRHWPHLYHNCSIFENLGHRWSVVDGAVRLVASRGGPVDQTLSIVQRPCDNPVALSRIRGLPS